MMFRHPLMYVVGLSCAVSAWAEPDLSPFDQLELIQEIDLAAPPKEADGFQEYPAGVSQVETILGKQARVLPNDQPGIKYIGYLLGKGKGLKANEPYLIEIEYPEDEPRSLLLLNRGDETLRGFHTGPTLGDALEPLYVENNPESLDIPLSGQYEKARLWVNLQERTSEIHFPRKGKVPDEAKTKRTMKPEDGFWFYLAQFEPRQDPLSKGTAAAKLRLYRIPDWKNLSQELRLPPADLPRRHLFFREEMADNVIFGKKSPPGFDDPLDWYRGKAKLMRFLGMNTMAKDLLEFGANQGWDSSKYGGDKWVYQSSHPQLWPGILGIVQEHGLSVLPYYEYAGSKGQKGLGFEKRALPLNGEDYTHIAWTESARADLTDPDTWEDFRRMLEVTIVDQKDQADIIGAWLRPRSSQLPISFADATLARYTKDRGLTKPITRRQLQDNANQYQDYLAWWNEQRQAFFVKMRDYLHQSGLKHAQILYTADPSETGKMQPQRGKALVAENPSTWKTVKTEREVVPLEQAIEKRWVYQAQTQPAPTWGKWEWQHASPPQHPGSFQSTKNVLPTMAFNRAYSVGNPEDFEAYTTPTGTAMIRHYSLNEDMLREDPKGEQLDRLGYSVADFERAGPYIMLAEAQAMANGNPTHLGYLASNNFNRTFPEYVRAFNAAFLSLPALPAKIANNASSDPDVVVRQIEGGTHGTWLAIVNPTYHAKKDVKITLPRPGQVTNAATGEILSRDGDTLGLDLYPCQLISLHLP